MNLVCCLSDQVGQRDSKFTMPVEDSRTIDSTLARLAIRSS